MTEKNRIIIASKNPVKINAIKLGFESVLNHYDFDFKGISASSDISDQPMTVEETYQGALNRIKNAKKMFPDANYYCGIEGGLEVFKDQYYAFAWILIDNGILTGKARTASFMLPQGIVKLIEQGYELGIADDMIFGHSNSKQKQGSVGILTHDKIDRTKYYKHAVVLALIPFINKELFR